MSTIGYRQTKIAASSILDMLSNCVNNGCSSGLGHFSGLCHIVVRTQGSCHLSGRSLGGVFMQARDKRVTPIKRFVALAGICKTRALAHFGVCASVPIGNVPTSKCDSKSTVTTVRRITSRALPAKCNCRFDNVAQRRSDDAKGAIVFCCLCHVCLFSSLFTL